jgi:thiol:disulfide interchange protein DsbD
LGGTALFVLALGMGVPLLIIGTSAGTLLPKTGPWMESVKRFFGVMMLAMAIWIASPVLALSVQMLLWAALLIFIGVYLHALDALTPTARGWQKLNKAIGIMALLLGAAYLIGGLSGARDILRPLGNLGRATVAAPSTLHFERIKNNTELDARIAQAKGKTVMLDFYADWCVSCKEMERFTFSDAGVQTKLKDTLLLQADVTANNADDKALLQRFQLFGPPATLFFSKQGQEMADFRVIGYQDARQFTASLTNVGL